MASEVKIRFNMNEKTGEKEIRISYEGEEDELPIEHERRHRVIVKELLGQGILNPDDLGKVRVDRTTPIRDDDGGQKSKPKAIAAGDGGDGGKKGAVEA